MSLTGFIINLYDLQVCEDPDNENSLSSPKSLITSAWYLHTFFCDLQGIFNRD